MKRNLVGRPNHWEEDLIKKTIRIPESMYDRLMLKSHPHGLSYAIIKELKDRGL